VSCNSRRLLFKQYTHVSTFPCEQGNATPTSTRQPTSTRTPTPTRTATRTPTPTRTPTRTTRECPLEAGSYTFRQVEGGMLEPDSIAPFPFPAGGAIVQDVGPPDADCVHETVVPFPGGFSAPTFCIELVGFTIHVEQTGCGVGRIDSDGGSDFDIGILGDTSSPNVCGLPQPNCTDGADSAAQVDITVGNGQTDTCAQGGSANAIVSIPVRTTVWFDPLGVCPDPDGTYDPGTDTLILDIPQIFDFSTDRTIADWQDLDPDGCCIAGGGPASVTSPCNPGGTGAPASTGSCLDVSTGGVTLAASGVVSSKGVPLFDVSFTAGFPYEIEDIEPSSGATCAAPPPINYDGKATRCINPDAEGQPASTSSDRNGLRSRKR
jgi:hypothetical protein